MANCPQIDPLITPYVDGEASETERAEVETHLGRCPPCQRQAEAESTTRTLLRERSDTLVGPVSRRLRERCQDTARHWSELGTPARRSPRLARPLALAAVTLLAVLGAAAYGLVFHPAEALSAQLTLDHLVCFSRPGAAGTKTAAAVSSDLRVRYGWDVPVPDGAGASRLDVSRGAAVLRAARRAGASPLQARSAPRVGLRHAARHRAAGRRRDPGIHLRDFSPGRRDSGGALARFAGECTTGGSVLRDASVARTHA